MKPWKCESCLSITALHSMHSISSMNIYWFLHVCACIHLSPLNHDIHGSCLSLGPTCLHQIRLPSWSQWPLISANLVTVTDPLHWQSALLLSVLACSEDWGKCSLPRDVVCSLGNWRWSVCAWMYGCMSTCDMWRVCSNSVPLPLPCTGTYDLVVLDSAGAVFRLQNVSRDNIGTCECTIWLHCFYVWKYCYVYIHLKSSIARAVRFAMIGPSVK